MNRSAFCSMPGRPCPKLATLRVAIPRVGERALCEPHWRTLVEMGLEVRRMGQDVHIYRQPVSAA